MGPPIAVVELYNRVQMIGAVNSLAPRPSGQIAALVEKMPAFADEEPQGPQKQTESGPGLVVVEEVPEPGDNHCEADQPRHGLSS